MDEQGTFGGEYRPQREARTNGRVTLSQLHRMLVKGSKGDVLPILANALHLLAHLEELHGMVGYNELEGEPQLLRAPPNPDGLPEPGPYPRPWTRRDLVQITASLQRVWHPKFTVATVEDAMISVSTNNRYHPVRDYLNALRWDGTPRVDTWIARAFGAARLETEAERHYRSMAGRRFLIAAVRRARHPGCKFDYCPVFEGKQGQGKSKTIEVLFGGPPFFTDNLGDLDNKEGQETLRGVWCVEAGELDRLLKASPETVKAFLSRSTDRYRPPYERRVVSFPRQCVIVGSTNRSDWLRDATGNRRFWPIRTFHADDEWVRANRDQLWAEAAMLEASGEITWLDEEDAAEYALAAQVERVAEDPWAERVHRYLDDLGRIEVTVASVMNEALNLPTAQQGKREQMRVADILADAGWSRHVSKAGGRSMRVWRKPRPEAGE